MSYVDIFVGLNDTRLTWILWKLRKWSIAGPTVQVMAFVDLTHKKCGWDFSLINYLYARSKIILIIFAIYSCVENWFAVNTQTNPTSQMHH